jgi:hypothetical protein
MLFECAADDRTVGEGGKPGGFDVDTQIGRVSATGAIQGCRSQDPQDLCRERRVLLRATRHRVDLAVEKFVLGRALELEGDVIGIRVPMEASRGKHVRKLACPATVERRDRGIAEHVLGGRFAIYFVLAHWVTLATSSRAACRTEVQIAPFRHRLD